MAIGDSSYDTGDPYAYPLCVPQDRLEDIDMFPSFYDDLINLNDTGDTPPVVGKTKRSVALRDYDNGVANDHKNVSDLGDIPSEKVAGETKPSVVFHYYDNSVANDRETKGVAFLQDSNSRETKPSVAFRGYDNSVANDRETKSVALQDSDSRETKQSVVFHYYDHSVAKDRETNQVALQYSDINRIDLQDFDSSVAHINCGIAKKKPRTSRRCGRELTSWLEWSNSAESWEENMKKRRCSHCKTEKTPQWREGPDGPKTLCNACGVRFRSGRLVAEYRPAKSPTFDNRKHSNFHKQILKRKQACV
ncbi:hypothetical protein FH972_002917 [Carpinus fangiana]|uniref:GATA-type domain-containing protein n=1 Tax=Carpinus fangiana TaxID=176857 RepID=A0A5N6QGV7_9ROSI|nr:hypothetical protein FH972_002917 [Carpinus fangiana]